MSYDDYNDSSDECVKGTSSYHSFVGLREFSENKLLWKMLAAEFFGTLLLVFVGCASCMGKPPSIIEIALTFGFIVGAIAQAMGHVSGGHINPAVSISMFVSGDISLIRAILFVIIQCVGSICGSAMLFCLVPSEENYNIGANVLGDNMTQMSGMLFEMIFTFVLVLVVHAVCDPRRSAVNASAGLTIGLTVAAIHLCGIKFTGASVNPARSLGPAVMMNYWEDHWIYWIGPIVGGAVAGLIYRVCFKIGKGDDDSYDF